MTVAEFKRKEDKPLNKYHVKDREGNIITSVHAHMIGVDVDAEQILFVQDNEELLAIVPFGMIVTKADI